MFRSSNQFYQKRFYGNWQRYSFRLSQLTRSVQRSTGIRLVPGHSRRREIHSVKQAFLSWFLLYSVLSKSAPPLAIWRLSKAGQLKQGAITPAIAQLARSRWHFSSIMPNRDGCERAI